MPKSLETPVQRAWAALKFIALSTLLGMIVWPWAASSQALRPVPALSAHVIDQTDTLDTPARAALEAQLTALQTAKGAQVVVLLVPSTAPEDIASYANRVGNAWKIGRKDVGDGVLLVVAKNDRKVRMEVAKALEGAIPDLAAKQIIDEALTPRFKQGDFAGGLSAAVAQMAQRIGAEGLPAPSTRPASSASVSDNLVGLIIGMGIATLVLRSVIARALGERAVWLWTPLGIGALVGFITASVWLAAMTVPLVFAALVFLAAADTLPRNRGGSAGWSHGGGGSSGSGGFSSGGGGDFGGGGASGDW